MKTVDDPILDESLTCIADHRHAEWGDRNRLDVFNRLLAKNIRPTKWTANTHLDIQPHQIRSRQEQWTTNELRTLRRRHSDSTGVDFDCPIVVVEYGGEKRLLDGNHRINRWIELDDTRLHVVNIHTVIVEGTFVELPSAA